MHKLEEIDKFLESYNLRRLNQGEPENMNRPITINGIETVIKNLPTNRSPAPDGFPGELYQTFREKLTPSLLKFFPKIAEESLFCEATITLIPEPKISQKKKITGQYH